MDRVLFKNPIEIGNLVTFFASINYTGKSSMEVGIKVVAEDIHRRVVTHTNSCYFTMVAIDEGGRPTPVPPFVPENAEEERRYEEAKSVVKIACKRLSAREISARNRRNRRKMLAPAF